MSARRRVLYMVHSGTQGGALLSLRYLLEQLDRTRYEPVAACIHDVPEVMQVFREVGVEAFHAPGIAVFPHTTGGWFPLHTPWGVAGALRAGAAFSRSARATAALVRRVRPDLVHLNSLVLAPSAAGARAAGARVVWHVRESVHPGHLGLRRRFLARRLRRDAHAAIFISEDDRARLTGGRSGVVIPNFVDHGRFSPGRGEGAKVREELGIPGGAPVVLFLGGNSALKGAHVLLAALPRVRAALPGARVIVAGAAGPWSRRWVARAARVVLPLLGTGTERQRFLKAYRAGAMEAWVHLLPFRGDPEALLDAADVLVFPSTLPHFARPVIEAGAMGKPVVASRIGGVRELVEEGVTGELVPPHDPAALADALVRVLSDPERARRLGEAGRRRSLERFAAPPTMERLMRVYENVLDGADGGERAL